MTVKELIRDLAPYQNRKVVLVDNNGLVNEQIKEIDVVETINPNDEESEDTLYIYFN